MASTLKELGWTDNFTEFKKKVEPLFGKLEVLAEKDPDAYAHLVLSHGFMEYAGVKGLHSSIKKRISIEHNKRFEHRNSAHDQLYHKYLKQEYINWAKQSSRIPA